jgi:hypothetical protein
MLTAVVGESDDEGVGDVAVSAICINNCNKERKLYKGIDKTVFLENYQRKYN